MPVAPGYASGTVQGAPSITELARALDNDVDEIYKFVYENIEFLPTYGSQKGAWGTLVDGMGNAFDMSELMVELLREAGYTASYMFGELELTEQEAADWLGTIDNNIWAARNLLNEGFIPNETYWEWPAWRLRLSHVWVKVNIGGTNYQFDPAKKAYSLVTGIDLGTAMGYNQTTFMSNATSGATITSDYVQNLNRTNIRDNLDTFAADLLDELKTNHHGKSIDEILGGKTIVPISGNVRQTSLPYLRPGTIPTEWTTDIPTSYYATLRVVYDSPNIDETFYSKDIHGLRLTLTFNVNNEAELRLDGTLVATSSAQGVGTWNSVLMEVKHPYAVTWADQSQWNTVWAGHPYLLAHAWGNAGEQMLEIHKEKFEFLNTQGLSADDEPMIGQSMSVLWYTWDTQNNHSCNVINKLNSCRTMLHHQIGVWGHFDTVFENLWGIYWKTAALDNDWDNVNTNDTAFAMHGIAFEAGVLEQVSGIGGVSSTSLIDIAIQNGDKLYDGNSSNWLTNVKPNLTNYSSQTLTDIENWWINANPSWRVAIPEDGNLTKDSWQGHGYYAISPWQGAIGIIGGGLKGGSGSSSITYFNIVKESRENMLKLAKAEYNYLQQTMDGDPVQLPTGNFLAKNKDIQTGSLQFPFGLEFKRFYDSSERNYRTSLGFGWRNNLDTIASIKSDGLMSLGKRHPVAGVPGLVELYIASKLFTDLSKPLDKFLVVSLANKWLLDQSFDNVAVVGGDVGESLFVKQPSGNFLPYRGGSSEFEIFGNGTKKFTNPAGESINFNADGKAISRTYPYGITVTYSYTNDKLTLVSNGLGSSLSLTYSNDDLFSVTDGNGRTVSFNVDGNGLLASVTDPESNSTSYQYDSNRELEKIFFAENPIIAAITNVYDTLGRVYKQKDSDNNEWDFYLAGPKGSMISPTGAKRTIHFNNLLLPIKDVNPLGDEILREFNSNFMIIKQELPEGNVDEFVYGEYNNLLSVTSKPKPGSGLSDITNSFTYDATWSKVATATNPLGNTTSYTYSSSTGLLTSITRPQVNGQTPVYLFSYDTSGRLEYFTDPTGIKTKYEYDSITGVLKKIVHDEGVGRLNLTADLNINSNGFPTKITMPNGDQYDITYDDNGNMETFTLPAPFGTVFELIYDKNQFLKGIKADVGTANEVEFSSTRTVDGQVSSFSDPDNNSIQITFDSLKRLTDFTDAENNTVETIYDDMNRVSTKKTNTNTDFTATYHENGSTASISDAKNNTMTFEYDGFDRLLKRVFSDSSFEKYEYDAAGSFTKFVDRSGNETTFTYDELNRVISKTPQGKPTISYEYDLTGRLKKISTPVVANDPTSGDFKFTYDSAGRFVEEEYPDGKKVTNELDDDGNITKITYPDGYYVERVYDVLGRLTDIKLNGNATSSVTITYDSFSRRKKLTYDNGVVTDYSYNKNDQLVTIEHSFNGATVGYTYSYDDAGKMVGQNVTDGSYLWHPSSAGSLSYANANNLNQYPSVGGNTYSYNANGCLTGDGTWTYTYDSENNLISASKTGTSVTFSYDPRHRQTVKTVGANSSRFIYSGIAHIADYDKSTDTLEKRYIYGLGDDEILLTVDSGGSIEYYSHDNKNSIVAVTNSSGVIQNQMSYSPFGSSSSMSGTTHGFTGQRYDSELDLYYMRYRYYSPSLGRFIQPDPLGARDSWNLYEYVKNSPLIMTDTLGLTFETNWKYYEFFASGQGTKPGQPLRYGPNSVELREVVSSVLGEWIQLNAWSAYLGQSMEELGNNGTSEETAFEVSWDWFWNSVLLLQNPYSLATNMAAALGGVKRDERYKDQEWRQEFIKIWRTDNNTVHVKLQNVGSADSFFLHAAQMPDAVALSIPGFYELKNSAQDEKRYPPVVQVFEWNLKIPSCTEIRRDVPPCD